MLLPSLVLYDQPHPQGEDIITSQDKDLAKKPDCLIIMGTSLKVVGIKRLVKDFIKGIREDQAAARIKAQAASKCLSKPATPSAAARAKKPLDKLPVIFVNKTRPDKEWEGLIDVWIEAECDAFAEGCEKIWRGVRPGDWEVQETLDDCRVGWKQVERAVQEEKGKAVGKSGLLIHLSCIIEADQGCLIGSYAFDTQKEQEPVGIRVKCHQPPRTDYRHPIDA